MKSKPYVTLTADDIYVDIQDKDICFILILIYNIKCWQMSGMIICAY